MANEGSSARRKLHALLAQRSYEQRRVRLASGRESDFYFDSKKTVLGSDGAYLAGELFLETIDALPNASEIQAVGGLELGSVPLGTAIGVIAHQRGRSLAHLVIRKQPKTHGTKAGIEGTNLVPDRAVVVVVEDVVTTGGSSLDAVRRLREAGYQVSTLITLIDREEGGREAIEAEGLTFVSLFTRSDFSTVDPRL